MGVIELATGLSSVPDAAGVSTQGTRTREVWTREERMRFERVAKDVAKHGDRLLLRCGADLCPDRVIKLESDASEARGAVLICGCTARVFAK